MLVRFSLQVWTPKQEIVRIIPKRGGGMGDHGWIRLLVRLVCTDMHIDRQTGVTGTRHQRVTLWTVPVLVEADRDGDASPGAVSGPDMNADLRMQAQRCWKCGRSLPGAERSSDSCGEWNRIIRQGFQTDPERRILVLDISDPAYPWT